MRTPTQKLPPTILHIRTHTDAAVRHGCRGYRAIERAAHTRDLCINSQQLNELGAHYKQQNALITTTKTTTTTLSHASDYQRNPLVVFDCKSEDGCFAQTRRAQTHQQHYTTTPHHFSSATTPHHQPPHHIAISTTSTPPGVAIARPAK